MQDLLTIVGDLRRRGIGFRSLHEAIDTTTPGGRLVFHIFAALAEFLRELIVEGTHEGLNAARARGQRLGRPPAMTPDQVRSARTLLAQPEHSVASIARLLGVSRSTIYKYLPELKADAVPALPPADSRPALPGPIDQGDRLIPMPLPPQGLDCPTCSYSPTTPTRDELKQHREELGTVWLFADSAQPGRLVERWHCEHCQPHQAHIVMCGQADTTVMLGGDLVDQVTSPFHTPQLVAQWLTDHGWIQRDSTWYCGNHTTRTRSVS